ncbi:MAG: terminase family protein, partial [bacterium]
MIAGRGAGKSTVSRVFALYAACRRPNHTVLVVSSGQRMSSDFGKRINDLIASSEIKNVVRSASEKKINLKNGSSISLLPAKPETIRGYHPRTAKKAQGGLTIILDEACYMEQGEEIRAAVEYAMITTEKGAGQMIIASSPSSVHSWVYPLFQEGQEQSEDIISFQWPSTVNPEIRPEEVERLRQSRTDLEFRAEVLAEWVEASQSLFTGLIEQATVSDGAGELLEGESVTLG